MFGKRLLTLGIAALLLTSCSMTESSKTGSKKPGKSISEEEATALFDAFKEKAPSEVGSYRVEYTIVGSSSGYNTKQNFVLMSNANGDSYYSSEVKEAGITTSSALAIQMKDTTYEEVSYVKLTTYNLSTRKNDIKETAIVKKDNPNYEEIVDDYMEENLSLYLSLRQSSEQIITAEQYNAEYLKSVTEDYNNKGYRIEIEYRSKGEGSLILGIKTIPNDDSVVEQYSLKRGDETLTFENYRFTELVSKNYYEGSTITITTKMSYGDNSFSLPSGWEKSIAS